MQINTNQNFALDYTTKSGKHLSFSMYDKADMSLNADEKSLSLKRQYGFSFSYEGSKLTQNDLDEIKNAMKEVEPLIKDFLENSKVKELKPKEIITSALKIANLLPTPKDENHKNAIANQLTNKIDDLINQNKTPKDKDSSLLEDSKKLMDEILKFMQEQLDKQMKEANKTKDANNLNFYA